MAQRLNKKLVIGLTIGGMVVTTAAAVVMLRAVLHRPDPGPALAQAEAAAARKDYEAAAKWYLTAFSRARAANMDPAETNTYRIKAGDMALAAGDARRALGLWNMVVTDDPANEAAQQRIVEFLVNAVEARRASWKQLEEEAVKLNRINPNNAFSLFAWGAALVNQRDIRASNLVEGEKKLQAAVELEKGNSRFAEALAIHYLQQNQQDRAVEVYENLIANLPEDKAARADAWRRRGQFYLMLKANHLRDLQTSQQNRASSQEIAALQTRIEASDAEALRSLQQAVELIPDSTENLLGMADYWMLRDPLPTDDPARRELQKSYLDKAEECYKQAIAADPDSFEPYLRLARLHMEPRRRDPAKALQTLQARRERGIQREGYLGAQNKWMMGTIRNEIFRVSMVQAEGLWQGTTTRPVQDELQEIIQRLEAVYKEQVADTGEQEPMALFMRGQIQILKNDVTGAIKSLERAESLVPEVVPEIKQFLSRLYLQTNELGPALEATRALVQAFPDNPVAWATMAGIQVQLGQYDEALQSAERALNLDPDNTAALIAQARVYENRKNWAKLAEIQQKISRNVDPASDRLQRAALLRLQATAGEEADPALLREAEQLVISVLQDDPGNETALSQLGTLMLLDQERIDELRQVVEASRENLRRRLADFQATQPAGEEARRVQATLDGIERMLTMVDPSLSEEEKSRRLEELIKGGSDPFQVALELARLYARQPNGEAKAYEQLKRAYELRPNDGTIVELLFGQALVMKDWPLAEQLAQKATTMGLGRGSGHFYRGRLLGAQSDNPENLAAAVRELRAGLAEYPTYSQGQLWLGRVLLELKQYDEAERAFAESLRLNPNNRTAALALASLAAQRGREEDKAKYLEICRRLVPDHPWVQEQLQAEADRNNPEQGIARREEIRRSNPQDLNNLMRLAELYARTGNNEKAREVYESALAQAPDNLPLIHNYANFLRELIPPQAEAATQLLRETVDRFDINQDPSPENRLRKATAQLMLASHLAVLVQRGLPGAPMDRKVIDETYARAAEFSDRSVVMSDIGVHFLNANRLQEAEEWFRKALARANATDSQPNEDERRSRKLLIETLAQNRDAARAADFNKELEAYQARFPEDPYVLMARSDHHSAAGRLNEALDLISQYIRRVPSDPTGYVKRADINYRRSLWSEALDDYRQSKNLNPQGFEYRPRLRLARCQENLGRDDLAIAELTSILNESENHMIAIQELIRLYGKQKNWKAAEDLIQVRYRKDPESPVWPGLLARIYKDSGRTDQAIAMGIEAARKSNFSQFAVDSLITTCLDARRPDDAIRFINEILPAELRESLPAQLRLATAMAIKGLRGPALEIYGRILDRISGQMEATMNIAQNIENQLGRQVAIETMEQRLAANPADRGARFALASLKRSEDNGRLLLETAESMLAALPSDNDPATLSDRLLLLRAAALVLYERKDYAGAKARYEEMLRLNPHHVVALNNLAYLLMEQMNDPEAALPYAERAVSLSPHDANILDTLGWNLILLGRYDDGTAILRRAIAIEDQLPALHYHAAVGFHRRAERSPAISEGDIKEAITELTRAHKLVLAIGRDPEGIMPGILELGRKLGLNLEPLPEAASAAPGLSPPLTAQ